MGLHFTSNKEYDLKVLVVLNCLEKVFSKEVTEVQGLLGKIFQ